MRQYSLVQQDIYDDVVTALPNETGETVIVPRRDPIYETRDVLDEDGNPTGATYDAFIGYGEPYDVEIPEIQGGFCLLGQYDDYLYLLTTSSNAVHVALNKDYDELFVPLMKWPDTETFDDRKSTRMATNIRSKLNDWRTSKNLDSYPSTILNGDVLQDTLELCGQHFDIIEFSIMASKD